VKTVKLGLIGAGGISQAHCRTMASIEGAEIIAVSDLVQANLDRAKENWGISKTFNDYNEMLEMDELEAVLVCTPTGVHGPLPVLEAQQEVAETLAKRRSPFAAPGGQSLSQPAASAPHHPSSLRRMRICRA